MAESIPSFAELTPERFQQLLRDSAKQPRALDISRHSERMLSWLGLVPAWPESYVRAGFASGSGMVSGPDAITAVNRVVADGLAESGRNDAGITEPIYWMSQAQADQLLGYLRDRPGGRKRLLGEMPQASQAIRNASASTPMPMPKELERWCKLADAAPDEERMAQLIDDEVAKAMRVAEERKEIACPEARAWIETATPIAELIGGPLHAALLRAERRFDLFPRRAADLRHLDNFLERKRQLDAFQELITGPDELWALHYVGTGGAGKTMLMRYVTVRAAPDAGFAVARIEFDRLNPEYPTRAPARLLTALAAELRLAEDTPTSVFEYFFTVAGSLHEKIDADRLQQPPDKVVRDVEPVLLAFVDALRKLEKRVLLILDTCEELAKLRPDGRIPENVRMTFDLLERIHREIPILRVIFSGRRPLASAGKEWTCRTSLHPPRPYLRLHIVSGFDKEEATDYLAAFHDGQRRVKPHDFEMILNRSAASGRALEQRFEIAGGSANLRADDRYNPRELAMYASLASRGKLTPTSGAHVWVKERIVGQVGEAIKPRLPLLALLGTFDRPLLEKLLDTSDGDDVRRLSDEILQHEWMERTADGFWTMDAITRERLLAFYHDQPGSLAAAERRIASVLPVSVLQGPWRELNVAWFSAALDILQRDPKIALQWWHEVEERLSEDGALEWAHRLTSHLLASEDGTWEQAAGAVPDPLLRASIEATHAAAATRMRPETTENFWGVVIGTIPRSGDATTLRNLRHRAYGGAIQSLQYAPITPPLLQRLRSHLAETPTIQLRDGINAAREIALREAAVEILERAATDPRVRRTTIESIAKKLAGRPANPSKRQQSFRPFLDSLAARVAVLLGQRDVAVERFQLSLQVEPATGRWLDWNPPADPTARLRLEALRGLALHYDIDYAGAIATQPPARKSLDADRLSAALLTVAAANTIENVEINLEDELRNMAGYEAPRCNAHRQMPSWLAVAIETLAASGRITDAMAICRRAMTDAEQRADVLHQNDLARRPPRLITGSRLLEEREEPPKIVFELDERSDAEAIHHYTAVSGRAPFTPTSRWKSFLEGKTTESLETIDADSAFETVWAVVADQTALMSGDKSSSRLLEEWTVDPRRDAVEALRVRLRLWNSTISIRPGMVDCEEAGWRVGVDRAAELAIDEIESTPVGRSSQRRQILLAAARWFTESANRFGALRATVLAARQPQISDSTPPPPITTAALLESVPESFPPAEAIMAAVRSSRGFDALGYRIMEPRIDFNRPWLMRLLIAAALSAGDKKRLLDVEGLVRRIYTTSRSPELIDFVEARKKKSAIRNDWPELLWAVAGALFGTVAVGAYTLLLPVVLTAAPITTSVIVVLIFAGLIWRSIRSSDEFLPVARALTIGIVVCVAIWAWWPESLIDMSGGLGSLIVVDAAMCLAIQLRHLRTFNEWIRIVLALKLIVHIGGSEGNRLILVSPFGWLDRLLGQRDAGRTPSAASSSAILLRNRLTDETALLLDTWIARVRQKPLPTFVIFFNSAAARDCWEAILDPSWFGDVESERKQRLSIARQVIAPSSHRPPPARFVDVVTTAPPRAMQLFTPAWDRFGRTFVWHSGQAFRGMVLPEARVVHLVGPPVMVRSELRLQIGESSAEVRGGLLRPDFAAATEQTVCCIVQGQPTEGPSTASDRMAASLLRQFSADVVRSGIPLVIVIPPLPPDLAVKVLTNLADAIVDRRWRTVRGCVDTIDEIRWKIAAFDPDLAYDVCVYVQHAPSLDSRFWFLHRQVTRRTEGDGSAV